FLCVLCVLCGSPCSVVIGQEVLAPPPSDFSQKAPVFQPWAANQPEATPPVNGTAAAFAGQHLLDWGPIHLHPHTLYRVTYGDGIQAQPGQQSKTVINEVSPGVLFDINTHWHLDYTPTLRFYSSSRFRDSLDHSVMFNGGTSYDGWVFGFSQTYAQSSTPLIETGSQTDQETFSTAVNAAYQLNSKVGLDFGVNQNFRFVGQSFQTNLLSDSRAWSTTEGLNYQIWPRFSVGVSAGFGYDALTV